jgi:2-desacetyl-2-hydroxyethyl bacteriochlorophyllide A dehydrogenase
MGSASMRAVVARGKRELVMERVPLPEPGPGEARVRVDACGLCGTDLHLMQGGFAPGHTPGHEIAGRVDALGPGVSGISVGDPVAVEPLLTCGACEPCRTGRDSICPQLRLLGVHVAGGFAEHVVVPVHRLFRVPRDLDARLAALAEPMAVVVHGLRRGGFAPGKRVLVLGAGAIGLLTVLAARAAGAREVLLTARHAHQAALGRDLGATRVLKESEASLPALMQLGRSEPADLVVETIGGQSDALRGAAWALAPGGAISVLGVFTAPIALDGYPLLLKEATLAWSNCYARERGRADFEEAVRIIDGERERLARLLTHSVPLDRIKDAYAAASDKKAGAVKVTVLPHLTT